MSSGSESDMPGLEDLAEIAAAAEMMPARRSGKRGRGGLEELADIAAGAERLPAKRTRITQSQIAEKKGATRTDSCESEFRHTSVYKALKELSNKYEHPNVRWTRAAVTMIASALEMRLRNIIKDAGVIMRASKRETLNAKTIIAAGEIRGYAKSLFMTPNQSADYATAVHTKITRGPEKPMGKAERKEAKAQDRKDEKRSLEREWNTMKESKRDEYGAVSRATTGAAIGRLLQIENIPRAKHLEVSVALTMFSTNFLNNVVRNILTNLDSLKRTTADPMTTDSVLKSEGFTQMGYSGLVRAQRQKRKAALRAKYNPTPKQLAKQIDKEIDKELSGRMAEEAIKQGMVRAAAAAAAKA